MFADKKPPKVKAVLTHLRGGSRSEKKKAAAEAADSIPPTRLFSATAQPPQRKRVAITAEAVAVRPYMCMCVLRLEPVGAAECGGEAAGVGLGPERLRRLIEEQNRIHDDASLGAKRTRCAIGTHDFATIRCWSPATTAASADGAAAFQAMAIDAQPPGEAVMVPLKSDTGATVTVQAILSAALAETTHGGPAAAARKYATMLEALPRVPLLLDSDGVVVSLPPLTNAKHTAVHAGTSAILVEVSSAVSPDACREAALALIAATIELVENPKIAEREPEPEPGLPGGGLAAAASADEEEIASVVDAEISRTTRLQALQPQTASTAIATATAEIEEGDWPESPPSAHEVVVAQAAARVTVEPIDVVCGWAVQRVRARFPSIAELRSFDEPE